MESLLNTQHLAIFLIFFVPGIIILYARSLFLTGRLPPLAEGAIGYVILSLLYHAIAYPIASPLYQHLEPAGWQIAGWFGLLFLAPMFLGILLGLNIRNGWTRKLFSKMKINTVHPVNTAWDWKFGSCSECWVLAVLKDGKKWAGYLGRDSFMSSIVEERDIYIEKVYELDQHDKWTPRTSSVWLAHGEIQSLEFWPLI